MINFDIVITSALALTILATFLFFARVIKGDTTFDRLLAGGTIGTNTILILIITGYLFRRPDMFVDLALTYALLNFVGTVAVSKFLENNKKD